MPKGKKYKSTGFVKRVREPESLDQLREWATQFGLKHGIESESPLSSLIGKRRMVIHFTTRAVNKLGWEKLWVKKQF